MAGIFGRNYSKPGKGVRKDEPQKPRFLYFWELFLRKFWKLVQLNLLYLLFCVPVVTIGPATAGLTYVLRNMATEQPVFLVSDFWDAFKGNWKQSFAYSLLAGACVFLVVVATRFYLHNAGEYGWMVLPAAAAMLVGLAVIFISYYAMLQIVTVDLPLKVILKNSAILALVRLKTNVLTLLFTFLLLAATFLLMPLGVLLVVFILPAWVGFIICYNSYPGIERYIIAPFRAAGEPAAPEEGCSLFRDEEPREP